MANETTSSTVSELYTEIVAEALFVAQEQSIMRGLVRNYTIAGGGKSVEVPIYSAIAAAAGGGWQTVYTARQPRRSRLLAIAVLSHRRNNLSMS